MCGWTGLAILALGFLTLVVAFVGILLGALGKGPAIAVGIVALVLSLGMPGIGVIGTSLGKNLTDQAVTSGAISPEDRERIRAVGYAEAQTCTTIGLTGAVVPALLALGAIGLGFARRQRD